MSVPLHKRRTKLVMQRRGSKIKKNFRKGRENEPPRFYNWLSTFQQKVSTPLIYMISIIKSPLHLIEVKFGSAGVAAFHLMFEIMKLNAIAGLFPFIAIILPAVKFFDGESQSLGWCVESRNCSGNLISNDNEIVTECSRKYIEYVNNVSELHRNSNHSAYIINDVITGIGILERTFLFIGTYPTYINKLRYPLGLVYILSMSLYYLVFFFYIIGLYGEYFRQLPLRKRKDHKMVSQLTFTAWDFSLCDRNSIRVRRKIIMNEFNMIIKGMDVDRIEDEANKKYSIALKRIVAKLLVGLVLVISWSMVYVLTMLSSKYPKDDTTTSHKNNLEIFTESVLKIAGILGITFLNSVYPKIYGQIAKLENYRDKEALHHLTIRLLYSRVSSLVILVNLQIIHMVIPDNCNEAGQPFCWETNYGQQIYSLVFIDMVISFTWSILVIFVNIVFQCLSSKVLKKAIRKDFDVANELMDCMQLQTITLTGTVAIPSLPLITVVILAVQIVLKLIYSIFFCRSSKRLFRSSHSSALFMSVVTVSYLAAFVPVFLFLFFLPSSVSCSPFRGLETPIMSVYYGFMFVRSGEYSIIQTVLVVLTSFEFWFSLLVFVATYGLYTWWKLIKSSSEAELLEKRLKIVTLHKLARKEKYAKLTGKK